MIEISENEVKRIAKIMGASSSAAMALTNAEFWRASGERVIFFRAKGYVGVCAAPGARDANSTGEGNKW